MFIKSSISRYALAIAAFVVSVSPAAALTGEEVMTDMSDEQSFAYIAGSIEMAAFLARAKGQNSRAQCIMDWYFGDGNGVAEVDEALSYFNDRGAPTVMIALINGRCPVE